MTEIEVEAGAEVTTLDDYGTAIYLVEEGEADVVTEGGAGLRGSASATRSARSHSS